jgi:hypothetical protein
MINHPISPHRYHLICCVNVRAPGHAVGSCGQRNSGELKNGAPVEHLLMAVPSSLIRIRLGSLFDTGEVQ